MTDRNNRTKKQHYVQDALIKNWESSGTVGIARKIENQYCKKEKSKSSSSIFYDEFAYEILHGFESMEKHAENDFSTSFDPEHPLRINDGEKYCKAVEDTGLPVIRKLLASSSNRIDLNREEKISLCRYLILQSIRTPKGRKDYLPEYPNIRISEASSNEETFYQFIGNIMYLMVMGVYDEKGISNKIDMNNSVFRHLCSLLEDMNGYVVRLDQNNKDQFIIGDNPCIIVGDQTIWGVVMPLSPKNMLILVSEKPERNVFVTVKCSKRLRLFELYSQFISSENKIVFCEDFCSLNRINKDIREGRKLESINQPIWHLNKEEKNAHSIDSFENLLKDLNTLFFKDKNVNL